MNILICRLCLQVTIEDQWKLYDKSNFNEKIRILLNLDIISDDILPQRLCNICCDKIQEINKFCNSVQENQQKLMQHLQKGSLIDYYKSLTTIKKEYSQKKYYKLNIQDVFEDENKELNKVLNATEFGIEETLEQQNNLIKGEEITNSYNTYTTDDNNLTLPVFKEDRICNLATEESLKYNLEQYNCLSCSNIYNSIDGLRQHYKKEHSNEIICTVATNFTEQIVNGNVKFKCNKCSKVYTKKNIKRHLIYHSNERPYVCKLCARTYKTVSDIMRHGFRAHSGHKLYCSYKCGFSTAYSGALKEHEDRLHKNIYKYTCKECGKGFQVKTWYDQHQNIHTGLKPFVCDICGVAFHMDKYLKSHYSTMHPQCSEKKRLVCLHCDQKWDSINALSIHLQKEHNITRSNTKSKRTCLCDLCGKVLNRPEQLHIHRKMHNGEKPYNCRMCGKSFVRKQSAREHERAHGRGRPYTCTSCGTAYTQRSALYRHQRAHHGLSRKRV